MASAYRPDRRDRTPIGVGVPKRARWPKPAVLEVK